MSVGRDSCPLLERIGDARLVLLGEALHGMSEYYAWRHRLSERLIREKGFRVIAGRSRGAPDRIEHRAIGVVYDPSREAFGNYVPTALPDRYDALLYIDETEALHPLHLRWTEQGEPPEMFLSGV